MIALSIALAAACGRDRDGASSEGGKAAETGDAPLPKPQATRGSVTGMPARPGPNRIERIQPLVVDESPPDAALADTDPGAPAQDTVTLDAEGDASAATAIAEPSPQDAMAVVQDYYAAIDRHDFARAFALWADGGRASGQTPQQFADGFGDTARVVVRTDAPGRAGAAAGSRYIEVPVAIEATQRDGNVRRYTGTYTLRRAVVDGASAEQRRWRIASARLHEAAQ